MAYEPPPEEEPPTYLLSEGGLKPLRKESQPAAPVPEPSLGRLSLQISLLGALLSLFLETGEWFKAAEAYLESREQARVVEPYRRWAQGHPLSYDEVSANPSGLLGKAVLWDIYVNMEDLSYFCEENPRKPVFWTNAGSAIREAAAARQPVKVLGRVDLSQEEAPLLELLEIPGS